MIAQHKSVLSLISPRSQNPSRSCVRNESYQDVFSLEMKRMARKTKAHLKLRPKKVALPPVVKKDPLDEFKKTSPHYRFETTPGGQRMLSAPNDSERSLLNFQPF